MAVASARPYANLHLYLDIRNKATTNIEIVHLSVVRSRVKTSDPLY